MMNGLEASILDDILDDTYGLWELSWGLDSNELTIEMSEKIDLLSKLVSQSLINVFFGRLGDPFNVPLSIDDSLEAIAQQSNWSVRNNPEQLVYSIQTSLKGRYEMDKYHILG